MSLRYVHILFIFCSTLLSIFLTLLFFGYYRETNAGGWMWIGVLLLSTSVLLPAYGVFFYRKLKRLGIY